MKPTKIAFTKKTSGVLLRTKENEYLHSTGGDWGPSHLPGPISEATVFHASNDLNIREVESGWGPGLTRLPVKITTIVEYEF